MGKTQNLLIVESPTKARTMQKYLGKDFQIVASYGHVRDLLRKKTAIDTQNGFKLHYKEVDKNSQNIQKLMDSIAQTQTIFLATDPDREGESIAWHILALAKEKKVLKNQAVHRVTFHAITKKKVLEAIAHPRSIDDHLVDAQQTRRALDHLVGFELSPLLWRKIKTGLSAGRVQSPALDMIVRREAEIRSFESIEYWLIKALLTKQKVNFEAQLSEIDGVKCKTHQINTGTDAAALKEAILRNAQGMLTVTNREEKERKRNPQAPFTTSTLQQEAARKLGFSASRTMRVAQQLYEGIDIGEGSVGLITYMRTDSVSIDSEALTEIRDCIGQIYGKDKMHPDIRQYKTKAKNSQEAHEAIRPANITILPDKIRSALKADQYKLYQLIWQRTIASQMISARFDAVSLRLEAPGFAFKATGSVMVEPGFLTVYEEGKDDDSSSEDDDKDNKRLPPLTVGEKIPLKDVLTSQHFTEPPPRYTEASLVKALEEHGIGRPSTYASIISTLQQRNYVEQQNKRFIPTDIGEIVNGFLSDYFSQYVDYGFTAKMEDQLDAISRGEVEWIPMLEAFWKPFHAQVEHIMETVSRKEITTQSLDENCPKCAKPLIVRLGKRGRFVGCSGYPDCDFTRSLHPEAEEETAPEAEETKPCPQCEKPLKLKVGKYGKFWGCSGYPNCKHIEPLTKPKELDVLCPECKEHPLLERKSRFGKPFFGCKGYPKCKFALWNPPIQEPCPKCAFPLLTHKVTKRRGSEKVCPQKECGFTEPFDPTDSSQPS